MDDEAFIDHAFAKAISSDEHFKVHVANLMKASRLGHICHQMGPELKEAPFVESLDFSMMTFDKPIGRYKNTYYLQRNWVFESQIVHHIKRLQKASLKHSFDPQVEENTTLHPLQQKAHIGALSNPLFILSGGPGCGKTYTASCIVKTFRKITGETTKIVLAAPTGKAIAHLEHKIVKDDNIRATTLHSLLKITKKEQSPRHLSPISADLLIIDECSMIDIRLFSQLLSSIEPGTHVVLMGDENQLPPIDAGTIFKDLCLCPIPHVKLEKCHRSDRDSILKLSDAIREGSTEKVMNLLTNETHGDISFCHLQEFSLTSLISKCQSGELTILSSLRKGPLGVDAINQRIFQNRTSQSIPIMISQTDHHVKLYNGEMGILLDDMAFFSSKREVPVSLLPPYEYAFAISVHKSQGSEYDHIVVIVPEGSDSFGKEILYTGVTRAKKSIQIVSTPEILNQCLNQTATKSSLLVERLSSQ